MRGTPPTIATGLEKQPKVSGISWAGESLAKLLDRARPAEAGRRKSSEKQDYRSCASNRVGFVRMVREFSGTLRITRSLCVWGEEPSLTFSIGKQGSKSLGVRCFNERVIN